MCTRFQWRAQRTKVWRQTQEYTILKTNTEYQIRRRTQNVHVRLRTQSFKVRKRTESIQVRRRIRINGWTGHRKKNNNYFANINIKHKKPTKPRTTRIDFMWLGRLHNLKNTTFILDLYFFINSFIDIVNKKVNESCYLITISICFNGLFIITCKWVEDENHIPVIYSLCPSLFLMLDSRLNKNSLESVLK